MRTKNYFNGSVEVRKSYLNSKPSSHQGKPDVLPYLNQLDKCTQILRQDRLYIRNQLKAGNQQLVSIFRSIRKPLNLQHLQIKLRKHITAVKSKAKMQQLMKFKQNMSLGQDKYQYQKLQNTNKSCNRQCTSYKLSYEKHKNVGNKSTDKFTNKINSQINNNNSQNRNKSSYSYQNYKKQQNQLNFQNTLQNFKYQNNLQEQKPLSNYQMPMQQITQRDSQNMTSTRHRAFYQDNFVQRIQQNKKQQNKSLTYTRWQKPQNQTKNNFLNNIPNFVDKKFDIPAQQTQQIEYQYNSNEQDFNQNIYEEVQSPVIPRHDNFLHDINNDIKDLKKNNDEHQKKYKQIEQIKNQRFIIDNNDTYQTNNMNFSKTKNNQVFNKIDFTKTQNHQTLKMQYNFQKVTYQPKLPQISLQKYSHSKTPSSDIIQHQSSYILSQNISKDQQIFTSPQLLMECKKFINKAKSNNNTDQKIIPPIYQGTTYYNEQKNSQRICKNSDNLIKPLQLDENFGIETKKITFSDKYVQNYTKNQIFTSIQNNNNKYVINDFDTKNNQFKQIDYSFPVVVEEKKTFSNLLQNKNKQPPTTQLQQKYTNNYQYFHTFAASNQKQKQPFSLKKQQKIVQNLFTTHQSPQNIVDNIMNNKVYNQNCIYKDDLIRIIKLRYSLLEEQINQQFQGIDKVNFSQLGRVIQDIFLKKNNTNRNKNNQVHTLCCLLDIQKNGYILEDNVADFLQQLENAQAQNFNQITEALWTLFDKGSLISQEGQKVIDYWGFYCIKQTNQFKQLQELLKEFQFEIDNSQNEIQENQV